MTAQAECRTWYGSCPVRVRHRHMEKLRIGRIIMDIVAGGTLDGHVSRTTKGLGAGVTKKMATYTIRTIIPYYRLMNPFDADGMIIGQIDSQIMRSRCARRTCHVHSPRHIAVAVDGNSTVMAGKTELGNPGRLCWCLIITPWRGIWNGVVHGVHSGGIHLMVPEWGVCTLSSIRIMGGVAVDTDLIIAGIGTGAPHVVGAAGDYGLCRARKRNGNQQEKPSWDGSS